MIEVASDFSGVGAFDQALRRLAIPYKTVFSCDMDKYARQTYVENYGEPSYYPENVYDRTIPEKSLDIYMTSPPCQAFSLAGKRKGEDDKRGILFYNSHEFIQKNNPRYFIIENVKGLLSDDSGKTFQRWIDLLGGKSVNGSPMIFPHEESVPYHVYWKVVNAKHHGVPQNRERVFIIGIRDDSDNNFMWPKEEPLKKKLKDVLEENVDEKYYLSEKMLNGLIQKSNDSGYINQDTQASQVHSKEKESPTISAGTHGYANGYVHVKSATSKGYETATEGDSINLSQPESKTRRGRVGKEVAQTLDTSCNQAVMIGAIRGRNPDNPKSRESGLPTQQMLEINESGVSNALTTVQKDNVVIQLNPSKESNGQQPYKQNRIYDAEGVSPVLDTECGKPHYKISILDNSHKNEGVREYFDASPTLNARDYKEPRMVNDGYSIRRLTPKECFNLMDFNENFYKTINFNNMSNSQGILLSLQNKKDIKWNVKELDAIEKQKLKECVCSIIKGGTNTVMKILSSNTHTEVNQNAQLKIAVEVFTAKDIVQNTTILTENGAILYLAKNSNQKLQNKQGKELLILEVKSDSEEKENLYTDYYLKLNLEENLKEVSASTILTTIQTITNCLTYIYSIPKKNTISVILSYKNYQKNFLKGELLNLKMGNTILSDSQLYKQAGNSIVVGVLAKLISKLNLE